MTYAALTGWGKCLPPAILTNADLSTFLPTDDAWITSHTGMKERRVSHVPVSRCRMWRRHKRGRCRPARLTIAGQM